MKSGYITAAKYLVVTAVTLLIASAPVRAADPTGLWLTEDGEAKVRIYPCGQAFCGKLAWLKEPDDPDTRQPKVDKFNKDKTLRARPIFGMDIFSDMRPSSRANEWSGTLYNPEDGNTYSGTLTQLDMLNLKLSGCVLKLFCRSETWKRTN